MNTISIGRLANALKVTGLTNNNYVLFPYNALFNFDIQDNFTYSMAVMPTAKDSLGAIRLLQREFSAGIAFYFTIDWYADYFYFTIVNNSNTLYWGKGATSINTTEAKVLNKLCFLDFVKYNANPTISVNPSEWLIYFNGVLLTTTTLRTSANLTPATDIKNTIKGIRFNIGSYYCNNIFADFKIYSKALSAAEVLLKYQKENRWIPEGSNRIIDCRFKEKNGKVLYDESGNNINGTLMNYTDSETANTGQPQSGNTVWLDAYTLQPITT